MARGGIGAKSMCGGGPEEEAEDDEEEVAEAPCPFVLLAMGWGGPPSDDDGSGSVVSGLEDEGPFAFFLSISWCDIGRA